MHAKEHAVLAEGLRKRYGQTAALDGFDLAVPAGTVLGLLGPNGAGKTTAVRILTTLLVPDGGSASVQGIDVVRNAEEGAFSQPEGGLDYNLQDALDSFEFGLARVLDGIEAFVQERSAQSSTPRGAGRR